jgi:transcriptional regulator GlxA family with amidase domain
MLVRTDLSIAEIARQTGFDGVAHVARYFRQETGMSLRQYRSQNAPAR